MPAVNLKYAAVERRALLDSLVAEAGNPDPDELRLRWVGRRALTEYDPFDDERERAPSPAVVDEGNSRKWKELLARLNMWAVQTAEVLRMYDEGVADHVQRLGEKPQVGNARMCFAKLSVEDYRPTLEGLIGDPASQAKLLATHAEAQSLIQNFHGTVGAVQGGSSLANVVQRIESTSAMAAFTRQDKLGAPIATNEYQRVSVQEARKCVGESGKVSPSVGVAVVRDETLLAVAFRGELKAGEHAEFTALERKLGAEALAGCTVFTTLEPCINRNHPKLPCADWLVQRRVGMVYIGMLDPNPDIFGKGVQRLRDAGIRVLLYEPEFQDQIEELNRAFIRAQRRSASQRATEQ